MDGKIEKNKEINLEEMNKTVESLQQRLMEIKRRNMKNEKKLRIYKSFTPLNIQKDTEEKGRFMCKYKNIFSEKQSGIYYKYFFRNLIRFEIYAFSIKSK